ncbi:hypothetical protein Tco_0546095 [Tanacetum coccineum]
MKAPKRKRSILDYRIQQLSKVSSEGFGIILEVPKELKDNSGSSSSSLFRFDDEHARMTDHKEFGKIGWCKGTLDGLQADAEDSMILS